MSLSTLRFSIWLKLFALLFVLTVFTPSVVLAKRSAPAVVAPISKSGVTYKLEREAVSACPIAPCKDVRQRLVARKVDQVVWSTELYRVAFDKNLETDVQEIYPRSMKFQAASIRIEDERAQNYVIDTTSGALVSPPKAVLYVFGQSDMGLVVNEIKPGSIYEKLGWKIGDRIVAVNDKPLLTADDIKNLPKVFEVDKTVGSKNLTVTFVRDGQVLRATYTIN